MGPPRTVFFLLSGLGALSGPYGLMARHHALTNVLHAFCENQQIQVAKELAVPPIMSIAAAWGSDGQGRVAPRLKERERVPADILMIRWDKGRGVAVDFIVTHPLQPQLPRSIG